MTAPAPVERVVVPDGDPCPHHGLPTRLLFLPRLGSYSQCAACRDKFLAWYGAQPARAAPALASEDAPADAPLTPAPACGVQLSLDLDPAITVRYP